MRKLTAIVAWLLAGHAIVLGLFWALVNVPDSNTVMLGATVLLAVVCVLVAALVEVTAAAWLWPATSFRMALAEGTRGIIPAVFAAAAFALFWWLGGSLEAWFDAHRGEIDAWFISTVDVTATAWIGRLIAAMVFVVRYVVGVACAVAIVHAWLGARWAGLLGLHWAPRMLSRYQLGLTALAMVVLVALPWALAYWRPAGLPATSAQLAFAAVKLTAMAIAMHVGWVLVLHAGVPRGN